ncbi:hypothetical protein [Streptomyces sp. ICC1]|uniref:hypothetical protein n=1 Tax=Streptomyces sp. ICC1 TaxID=2099583 RepID=UPI0013A6975C|nr:hypothetical protein [Streptomyces sp. ICC1]
MHTLGHPDPSHAMEDASVGRSVAPAAGHGSAEMSEVDTASAVVSAAAFSGSVAASVAAAEAPGPHTGMDPMSVCVAVLGTLTLLILGAGLIGPRRAAPLGGAARAPGRSGGPDPPPPRELLTLLAVLRV